MERFRVTPFNLDIESFVTSTSRPLTYLAVLSIAGPIVLSNLSTPLLGIIDTGIIGQLGDPAQIGAVAVGAMIFNFIYWGLGFLRMGTTGQTAQAFGASNEDEMHFALFRPALIAVVFGLLIVLLQPLICWAAFSLVTPTSAVEGGAREYFSIRIWSAPFTLFNMVILGWFIGRQQANLTLFLQLFVNGTNALLDAVFVLHMGWGVEGIATGTVIAEIAAAVVGYLLVVWQLNPSRRNIDLGSIFEWPALRQTLTVNRHLMVRTFFIVFVFAFFTAKSAESGEILLAANAILMHFVFFTAYLLDGFAFAAETFVGEAIGMGSRSRLQRCINLSTVLAGVTASIVSLGIYCFGSLIIDVLTVSPEVRFEGRIYLDWLTILPLVSFWCWQLDGIFIGALRSEPMQNATFWAWCGFMASWTILQDGGNHGLWLTMILFNIMRGVFLGWYLPSLVRSIPQTRA